MARVASLYQKKNFRKAIAKRASTDKARAANARRGVARKNVAPRRANQRRRQQLTKICSDCASCESSLVNMLPRFEKLVNEIKSKKVTLVAPSKDKVRPRLLRKTITGPLCDMPVKRKRAVVNRKLNDSVAVPKNMCGTKSHQSIEMNVD